MRFIAPRTDFAFKKIFGSPEGLEPLRSFIEAVMDLHGSERLAELQLVDPYQPGQVSVLKRSYLDVKCSDLNGRKFLIEMQVEPVKEFAKRVVYNAAKAYVGQLERAESYLSLTQVVAISICDFVMFPEFEHYLSEHIVRETLSSRSYLDEVRYYFLELPKFQKDEDMLTTAIDKWAFFLRNARSLEQVPKALSTEPFATALHLAEWARLSPKEWEEDDRASVYLQDQRGKIDFAIEKGLAMGRAEGKAVGKAEGRVESEAKGKAVGKAESVLAVLEARGFVLDERARKRILDTTEIETLDRWLRAASLVSSVDELFEC